jgi:prevent-host-death family protein
MCIHPEVVNIHEAKTTLSKLIEAVQRGEEAVIIGKAGRPVAKLIPYVEEKPKVRRIGGLKGKVWMAPDFDKLPDEVYRAMALGEDV